MRFCARFLNPGSAAKNAMREERRKCRLGALNPQPWLPSERLGLTSVNHNVGAAITPSRGSLTAEVLRARADGRASETGG